MQCREERLTREEVTGATFTISNLGMYGIDTFHAIIVPGQSAILAVGKVTKRGVVIEDDGNPASLEIRPMMKVSLSADHRVLDGASGSRFLHQLKLFLEVPLSFIMTLRGRRSRQLARWPPVSMDGSAMHRGSCRRQNVSGRTGKQSLPRDTIDQRIESRFVCRHFLSARCSLERPCHLPCQKYALMSCFLRCLNSRFDKVQHTLRVKSTR